jgi:hypothetical protein
MECLAATKGRRKETHDGASMCRMQSDRQRECGEGIAEGGEREGKDGRKEGEEMMKVNSRLRDGP